MHRFVITRDKVKLANGKITGLEDCNGQMKLGALEVKLLGRELHLRLGPEATLRYMRRSGCPTAKASSISRPSEPFQQNLKKTEPDMHVSIRTQTDDWKTYLRSRDGRDPTCIFCDLSPADPAKFEGIWAPDNDEEKAQDNDFAESCLLICGRWLSASCAGKFYIRQQGQSFYVGNDLIFCREDRLHIGGLSWTLLPMTELKHHPDLKALSAGSSMAPPAARLGTKMDGHWKVKKVFETYVGEESSQVQITARKLVDANGTVHRLGFHGDASLGPGLSLDGGRWWCHDDILHYVGDDGMYAAWDRVQNQPCNAGLY